MSIEELAESFCERLAYLSSCIDMRPIFTGEEDSAMSKYVLFAKQAITIEQLAKQLQNANEMTERFFSELQSYTVELKVMSEEIAVLSNNVPEYLPVNVKASNNVTEEKSLSSENKENKTPRKTPSKSKAKKSATESQSQKGKKRPPPPVLSYLTAAEFGSVPKYMKGRTLYSEVNKIIDVINQTAEQKYKIVNMSKNRSQTDYQRRKQSDYLEQESKDTDGKHFVTIEDIKEFSTTKVDRQFQKLLTILRHCGRLKEIRSGHLTKITLIPSC